MNVSAESMGTPNMIIALTEVSKQREDIWEQLLVVENPAIFIYEQPTVYAKTYNLMPKRK